MCVSLKHTSKLLHTRFKDKCDSVYCTSVRGFREAEEGSFERPKSNEQFDTLKPPEVYLWRPHRRL